MQIVSVHEAPADLKCYSFIVCKYIILYFKIPWCRGEVGTVFCYWSPWIIDFNSIWPISLLVVITKMQPWFLSSQVRGCLGAWLQNTKIFCLFKFSVALGWIPWIYDLLHSQFYHKRFIWEWLPDGSKWLPSAINALINAFFGW